MAKPLRAALEPIAPFALALFVLATTRWGTFLFPGPPYIVDLVLGALLLERAFAVASGRVSFRGVDPLLAVATGALVAWSAASLLVSPLSVDALRDAAPYLYALLVFVVAPIGGSAKWSGNAITAVLVFHLAWVTMARFAGSPPPGAIALPGDAYVFEFRADVDSTVCGLLAAISLHRALLGRAPVANLALAGWGAAIVVSLNSRAGLLAFFVQLAAVAAMSPARTHVLEAMRRQTGRAAFRRWRAALVNRALAVAVLVVVLPFVALQASEAGAIERLTATFAQGAVEGTTESGAAGTAGARFNAWERLVVWLSKDADRTIAGVGPGPDYLQESGAKLLLLGPAPPPGTETRHPHNYFLTTWARFGIIGLALAVAMLFAALRLAVRLIRNAPVLEDVDVLAIAVSASFPVAGALGVILETPFGAVPYFWALGHLSARACQLRLTRPLAELVRPGWRPSARRATP